MAISAEAKTLKFLGRNKSARDLYKTVKAYEAGLSLGDVDTDKVGGLFDTLKRSLLEENNLMSDNYGDYTVIYTYSDGKKIQVSPRVIISLLDKGVDIVTDPGFGLEKRIPIQ